VATGAVMGRAAPAIGRTSGSYKTFRPLEGKFGHLFFQMVLIALWTTDNLIGSENNGFKILIAVQTGIFVNRHIFYLLFLGEHNHFEGFWQALGFFIGHPSSKAAAIRGTINS
jgi:hypothetical protein